MAKKSTRTPRSQIRNALRLIWLRSRERSTAMKREHYTCQICGVKQSAAKDNVVRLEVHHKDGIQDWDRLIDAFYAYLLPEPGELEVLCKDCHEKRGCWP